MSTVSRYLLREFALASGVVLLAFLATWIAADTLLHLDELGTDARAWTFLFHRMLDALPLGAPMACAVGVVWSVTRAVRSREITAIRCGGIPLRSALLPIVAASLLIAVLLGWFEDRVIVKARRAPIGAPVEGAGESGQPELRNGHWWYAKGPWLVVARSYDAGTRTARQVTVFERSSSGEVRTRIDAATAIWLAGDEWELRDAMIREFARGGIGQRSALVWRLELGLRGSDFERARRPLPSETLHGLAKRMRDESRSSELTALQTTFHGRLARPLAALILVLLAIPFAVGDVERGDSLPRALVAAMVAASIFWVGWSLALLAARSGVVPPPFPIWGAVLGFLAIGAWRFAEVRE